MTWLFKIFISDLVQAVDLTSFDLQRMYDKHQQKLLTICFILICTS